MRRFVGNQVLNSPACDHKYHVCLSFAGEDRLYVEVVAAVLDSLGITVFYDAYERIEFWGKNLYDHLYDVYQNKAQYCVMFISKHYAGKLWTNHERRNAQARALKENENYILPVRFDDTPIDGLLDTLGYLDLNGISPDSLATMIAKRIGLELDCNLLPENLRPFFAYIGIDEADFSEANENAERFFFQLQLTTQDERLIIYHLLFDGCPAELPDNVHLDLEFLKRVTGFSRKKIMSLLKGIESFSFLSWIDSSENHEGRPTVYLTWHNCGERFPGNATGLAQALVSGVAESHCMEHGRLAVLRLDFSRLADYQGVQVLRDSDGPN